MTKSTPTRRVFMTALPAIATVPTAVMAQGYGRNGNTDPHPEWFAEWKRIEKDWMHLVEDSPEQKAAWDAREDLAIALANTKATTVAGLAAQFAWLKEDVGYYLTEMVGVDLDNALNVIEAGFGEVVGEFRVNQPA